MEAEGREAPGDGSELRSFLERELGRPVRLAFTRARKTPIQARTLRVPRSALEVRLHGFFAAAPDDVKQALARWLRAPARATSAAERLDAWIEERLRLLPPAPAPAGLSARGVHHDLESIARELCASELAADFPRAELLPPVVWGSRTRSRTRGSLRLGSFDPDRNLARIHPVLDQPFVPRWFVRYVVFHELLHAALPPRREGGRWIHHGAAFRAREEGFADTQRALAWEREHLPALVRSARRAEPVTAPSAPAAPLRQRMREIVQLVLFGADPARPGRGKR
jgi:hypothetical protein